MATEKIIQGQGSPVITNLRRNIQLISNLILQQKLKEKQDKQSLESALNLYKEKLKIKQKYPDQPSVSVSVTPHSLSEQVKATQILGHTPTTLKGSEDLSGYTTTGPTDVPGGELGPLGKIQQFFGGTPKPRQVDKFTPEFEALRAKAQAVQSGKGKTTKRTTYGKGSAGQVLGGEGDTITLPDTITTTSEAVKWLMEEQGMSEEEAKLWITTNAQ